MKTILLIAAVCCFFAASAQQALREPGDLVHGKSVYVIFNPKDKSLKYFDGKDRDGRKPLEHVSHLALREPFSNIYMKWLNPLKYNVVWKDSVFSDGDVESVKKFLELFSGVLGSFGESEAGEEVKKSTTAVAKSGNVPLATKTDGTIYSSRLFEFYLFIETVLLRNDDTIAPDELKKINEALNVLYDMDEESIYSVQNEIEHYFFSMYELTDRTRVETLCSDVRAFIKEKENSESIVSMEEELKTATKEITVAKNINLTTYIKNNAIAIAADIAGKAKNNKVLFEKMEDMAKTLEKSVDSEQQSSELADYFLIREVKFNHGQVLETKVTVSSRELNQESGDFGSNKNLYEGKIRFQKRKAVLISFSTGVFYSDVTIRGFGVSTDENPVVTEDDLEKKTAIPAAFLNLNFDVGSSNFSPLIQFGADPTKARPYLLAGAGFSIPVVKIAISGGPLWTWEPALKTLEVGGAVESTSALEKDIKYTFDGKPKGWYVGLQVNF